MSTITVRYAYCPDHAARHMIDEHEHHVAADSAEMLRLGYRYLRHVGGALSHGWYAYQEPATPTLPIDWQMAETTMPDHVHVHDLEVDF